jgi:aldehyde decarbonylase
MNTFTSIHYPIRTDPKFVLNGQYLVLVPAVLHTAHRVATKGWGDLDPAYATMLPALLLRMIHNQIWISLSRYQTARRKNVIVDRSIEFEQVDRERSW